MAQNSSQHTPTPSATAEPARTRVQVEVSPSVLLLLDHISDVLGTSKAQLVSQALLDALPALVERADAVKKRARELAPQPGKNR